MRLLHRFWYDVAQGDVEIFAVMLASCVFEHREDRGDGFLEHLFLGLHVAAERRELGDGGTLAHAEFAAPVGEQIEHRDALGDTCGVVGRELEDAVAEPDVPGALARGCEKRFRRGRVRVFFEKVMLDDPGVVVAELVCEFHLRERVLVEAELVAGHPRTWQLQLIEDAELHDASPAYFCCGHLNARGGAVYAVAIPPCGRRCFSARRPFSTVPMKVKRTSR